ncbi:MAG: DUF192 domain-containing protein [Candidatus Taylorbacteria bacterium]|nr:DUF192 domain-containing protein [Candidatus Taylorbacteria bacterium]
MKYTISICIVLAFVFGIYMSIPAKVKSIDIENIYISGTQYKVILANTDELRRIGLSGRESLPRDTVMVFTFDTPDKYGFWMKDMKFPIDIMWVGEDMRAVHIERNVSPDTYPEAFYPDKPSVMVIEGDANLFERVEEGDEIRY